MDTFFEQIVNIKKNGTSLAAYIGIWVLAIILIIIFFMFPILGMGFGLLFSCGVLYGAYWLSSKLNVEYEYIITNGSMDIDKIVNKSSRKRILSFELPSVTRLEKYNPALLTNIDKKEVVIACNPEDKDVYFMVAEKAKGNAYLVFAPDSRIISAIEKFAPKFVTNNVFK